MNVQKLKERYGIPRTPKPFDVHMVEKLDMYAENESSIYNQKKSILENLRKKAAKGVYSPVLAAKLWGYWVTNAAKQYAKEFDGVRFTKADRDEVARRLEKRYPKGAHL